MKVAVLASSLLVLSALALPAAVSAEGMTTPAPAVCPAMMAPQTDLFTPKPTPKSCFLCLATQHSTPTYTATGSSCSATSSSLKSQAITYASTDCVNRGFDAYCAFTLHPGTCTQQSSGVYLQQGYATYQCSVYVC